MGLVAETPKLLPKSPMGQAAAYALRDWQALSVTCRSSIGLDYF
jgi:hypothetical protein